jgi:hypothetical protein
MDPVCPKYKNVLMKPVGEDHGGFSGGKAVVGAVLLGPIGLLGGMLGKKKVTYQCPRSYCGYIVTK